jgi:hypothetical protein
MGRLASDRPAAGTAHLLLFLAAELLPVLMKVLPNFGQPTAYEHSVFRRSRPTPIPEADAR